MVGVAPKVPARSVTEMLFRSRDSHDEGLSRSLSENLPALFSRKWHDSPEAQDQRSPLDPKKMLVSKDLRLALRVLRRAFSGVKVRFPTGS
jgi:hypothetical protein